MDLPDIISELPPLLQYIIAALIAVGALWALWDKTLGRLWGWVMHNWWPSREHWSAGAIQTPRESDIHGQPDSDPNSAWMKDRFRWSQGWPMQKSDWYHLYFKKPRALSEIIVVSYDIRFPRKFNLYTAKTKYGEWTIEVSNAEMQGFNQKGQPIRLNHRFGRGRKIAGIKLEIVEPNYEEWLEGQGRGKPPAWAIYSIDFKEYMFFSRFMEHKIG